MKQVHKNHISGLVATFQRSLIQTSKLNVNYSEQIRRHYYTNNFFFKV